MYDQDHARLKDHVASMRGKLDAQIHEGGNCNALHNIHPTELIRNLRFES
jgi:hypothetical protein